MCLLLTTPFVGFWVKELNNLARRTVDPVESPIESIIAGKSKASICEDLGCRMSTSAYVPLRQIPGFSSWTHSSDLSTAVDSRIAKMIASGSGTGF
jgi:hypothetical protein